MIIFPRKLSGTVTIPPSKSDCHRAIICASLASGTSVICNTGTSDDVVATINIMRSLGAKISRLNTTLSIDGSRTFKHVKDVTLDCNESGSTLRFLIPLALHANGCTFIGSERLGERPLNSYYDIFDKQNISYQPTQGRLPLRVEKGTLSGVIELPGNVSSQYVSGLLFALPLFEDTTKIVMTSPLESRGYVDLTIRTLELFGISVRNDKYETFEIMGGQEYSPMDYTCEADFSQAAFFLAAGALGNDVACNGLYEGSLQGDKEIINIIEKMGGTVTIDSGVIKALPSKLHGIRIDVSQIPDLVPILAVLASFAEGETVIYNAERLRIKESDRLTAIRQQLNIIGGNIKEVEDTLVITPVSGFTGGEVSSCNDHRIAMALGIASTRATGDVRLIGEKSVSKSYPTFWDDFTMLGGVTHGQ